MSESCALIAIWELTTFAIVITHVWLLRADRRGRQALYDQGINGSARLVSWQDVRNDGFGLGIGLVLMAVGWRMPLEEIPPDAHDLLYIAFTSFAIMAALKVHDRGELLAAQIKEREASGDDESIEAAERRTLTAIGED